MRKLFVLALVILGCLGAFGVQAEEAVQQNAVDWEISMKPKPTEEEREAARWSVLVENNVGLYAYDMASLAYGEGDNGAVDKNIVSVLTKTVFTDKETLKKLNKVYASKLAKKEKAQYCEIMMTFNLAAKTYRVAFMDVYGSKRTLLQHTEKKADFVPVPEGSIAEAMLEICRQAAAEEEAAANTAAGK